MLELAALGSLLLGMCIMLLIQAKVQHNRNSWWVKQMRDMHALRDPENVDVFNEILATLTDNPGTLKPFKEWFYEIKARQRLRNALDVGKTLRETGSSLSKDTLKELLLQEIRNAKV